MKRAGDVISTLFREQFGSDFLKTARSDAGLFSSWAGIVEEAWRNESRKGPGFRMQKKEEFSQNSELENVPEAVNHSRIRELERGQLFVEADHPGWIQILQTRQHELLTVLKRRYPELGINSITFRLSREPF